MNTGEQWWKRVLVADAGSLDAPRRAPNAERYVLLPKPADPRVVVDAASGPALSEALRRFVDARSLPAPLSSAASRLAPLVSRTAPGWYVSADPGQLTLREHLASELDADVRLSIAVGPPRPNRKPVVRCWVGDQLMAVAKLGPDPHTAAMVRNEAQWLARLTDDPIDAIVPEVLHHGAYGTSELLVMSVLPLESDAGVPFADVPNDRLHAFVERHRRDGAGLHASSWWRMLQTRLEGLDDDVIRAAVDRAGTDAAADELSLAAWHGDWSPWNVGHATDGRWCIWDWERTALDVPVGFDQLHLHHQYGNGLAEARPALAAVGVDGPLAELTRRLYLLELAARHGEADAVRTDRHETVLQLLRADAEGRGDTVARVGGAS